MTRTDHFHDPDAPQPNSIAIAVSAFVLNEAGDLLMIRRSDNDRYAIPGGQHELGETLSQTVVREVDEETGIAVEPTGVIGLYSNPAHVIAYDDGEVRQEFSICFRARPTGGRLRTSSESKEALWVPRSDVDNLNIHPSIQLRIRHGFEGRTEPFYT
ncbi:NUDIX hydrolase [Actinoalloteichus hymeniacidonis]|uniref:ADP-ribose pyrophosphatase n=1 Tax=Actinoalloteichus hymeniacidonis TaxID=340345 RepID=A0AAC9MVG0_9PSEU|nr:NUDIX domain-containing protein [Actinoalloteichus hymeniacidonis]AOS61153.1 ADP-ribose pyrophosphatase [Actinoalloteichus hymeniacidonis]MBB5910846.1 ADP-ribose pyrophosphatase YjhB (NUDIX family) [Actinoalloteichus hymeniacidonis]